MSQIVWEVAVETDTLAPSTPPVPVTFAIYAGTPGRDGTGGTSAVISPSTPTQSLNANYLLRVSADGSHVDQVNPNTFDAANAAANSMAAHLAAANPHTQYLLSITAAGTYSVIGHVHSGSDITTGTLADARLSANIPRLDTANTFTNTQTVSKLLIPPQVTALTNPLTIRSNTGVQYTEPSHYIGIQGLETVGIALRSNGSPQFLGQISVGQYNDIQIGGSSAQFGFARGGNQNFQLDGIADATFDSGVGTSISIGASAKTSTTAKMPLWKQICSWFVPTQATRLGQIEEFVSSYLGWIRSRRVYTDGPRAYTALTVHTTPPADADLQASELAFYTDTSSNLLAKIKDSGGVVHAINATGGGGSSGGATFSGPINYPAFASSVSTSGYSRYYDSRTFPDIVGNATTDISAAVRAAIKTIDAAGGGKLYMSPVRADGVKAAYKFGSAIGVLPANVSIDGPYDTAVMGIGNSFYGTDSSSTITSSFLTDPTTIPGVWLIYADAGTTANSFMKPWKNTTISGIPIYYPNQAKVGLSGSPTPYPWFIEVGVGSQVAIRNIGSTNAYQLIRVNGGWRTLIDNIIGQVYWVGIQVDDNFDVCRINRVEFECQWDAVEAGPGYFTCPWTYNNGYGFVIHRCDLLQMIDCFAYAHRYGLVLQSADGTAANSPWATFTNTHFDFCGTGIVAQQTQKYGATFSNCMFTFNDRCVDIQAVNAGTLSFNNCLFNTRGNAVVQAGTGEVNITGSTFDITSGTNTNASINHTGGIVMATGNNFRGDVAQYQNATGAVAALLATNRVKGAVRMPNAAAIANFLQANNLAS